MQIIRGNFNIQLSKKTKGNFLLVFGSKMFSIDVKPIYCKELDQNVRQHKHYYGIAVV